MAHWIRFIRPWRRLHANEVQAKIPMLVDPASPTKRTWALIPVRDPEIYPLLACVGTAVALLAVYCVHNFTENPDVNVNKTRRETPTLERYSPEDAQVFTKHHQQLATVRRNPVNTDESFVPLSDAMALHPPPASHEPVILPN